MVHRREFKGKGEEEEPGFKFQTNPQIGRFHGRKSKGRGREGGGNRVELEVGRAEAWLEIVTVRLGSELGWGLFEARSRPLSLIGTRTSVALSVGRTSPSCLKQDFTFSNEKHK